MSPPGSIAIDFTRTRSTEADRLTDYSALIDWSEHVGVTSKRVAAGLRAEAAAHPRRAGEVHAEAVALREGVYQLLKAVSAGSEPEPGHLRTLNAMLRRAAPHRRLIAGTGGCDWSWEEDDSHSLEAPLWRVAQATADLLTSEWVERLGVCAADTCQWLFVDESRNRSRRWCDMSDCGTRAKVRRFRAREKAKERRSTKS